MIDYHLYQRQELDPKKPEKEAIWVFPHIDKTKSTVLQINKRKCNN